MKELQGIEKSINELWDAPQPKERILYTDAETAKWALVKDEVGDNVVRENPICEDCIIGYEDGYESCDKGLRYETNMPEIATFLDPKFSYCPKCGRKL